MTMNANDYNLRRFPEAGFAFALVFAVTVFRTFFATGRKT
jgi:hypothetical protein